VTARERHPFDSAVDFMNRTHVNRQTLQLLILAGAFDDFGTPLAVATDLGLETGEIDHILNITSNLQLRTVLGEIAGIGYPVSESLAVLLDLATAEVVIHPPLHKYRHLPCTASSCARGHTVPTCGYVELSFASRPLLPSLASVSSLLRWKMRMA